MIDGDRLKRLLAPRVPAEPGHRALAGTCHLGRQPRGSRYPRRLKARLKEDAPADPLWMRRNGLLETGGLAVVGSRHVDES